MRCLRRPGEQVRAPAYMFALREPSRLIRLVPPFGRTGGAVRTAPRCTCARPMLLPWLTIREGGVAQPNGCSKTIRKHPGDACSRRLEGKSMEGHCVAKRSGRQVCKLRTSAAKKRRSAKKATVKRASPKKAVAKRASPKKAAVKRASHKKPASPKKPAAKRASPKKVEALFRNELERMAARQQYDRFWENIHRYKRSERDAYMAQPWFQHFANPSPAR